MISTSSSAGVAVAGAMADLALVRDFAERWRPRIECTLADCVVPAEPGIGSLLAAAREATGVDGVGGHRWRPLLTLAAVEACGGQPDTALRAACAVELTHTASLVLDDLPCMDDSPVRRGQPATHIRVGPAGAILVAVGLLGRAAELLGEHRRIGAGAARAWGQVVGLSGMAGGQGVDLDPPRPLAGAARRLHRRKTTALSAWSLGLGADLAGADPITGSALERFGRDLGWAYQVADDAADVHEDTRAGRRTRPATAGRAIRFLMGRAERAIGAAPGLTRPGRRLLIGFAATLIALATPDAPTPC